MLHIKNGEEEFDSTTAEFLADNAESMAEEEADAIKALKPGETYPLPVHFGYCLVSRVAP